MSDEEILVELRTIRTLLALDKEEEMHGILSELGEVEQAIIDRLDDEWTTFSTSEVAEKCDVGTSTVGRRVSNLEEANLIEKRGSGRGTEYRETGLLRAAELVSKE
jgi:DNA-binding MarR family transcriptional regulator